MLIQQRSEQKEKKFRFLSNLLTSFNGTSFGKAFSSEVSNERLECTALTSVTGKLEAEKNGVRNRINQPV